MVEKYNLELYKMKAELCKTLSNPKRLIIVQELQDGEKAVGELADLLDTPQSVISNHLSLLRDRGVVKSRREGTSVYYDLSDPKIGEACALVHEILLNHITKNQELGNLLSSR